MQRNNLFSLIISSAIFLLLNQVYAIESSSWYTKDDALKNGISNTAYNSCKQALNQCPKNSGFYDNKCLNNILSKNPNCSQTKYLLNKFNINYDSLTIEAINNYSIIDHIFLADGQHEYYIISPTGYVVNTKINPLAYNKQLVKKYQTNFDVINNFNAPYLVKRTPITFATILTAKDCVACKVILCSTAKFTFSKRGVPVNLTVSETPKLCNLHS